MDTQCQAWCQKHSRISVSTCGMNGYCECALEEAHTMSTPTNSEHRAIELAISATRTQQRWALG